MKNCRWFFLGLGLLLLSTPAVLAQSYRLNGLVDQLATQADALAERSYEDYRNSSVNNRNELDTLYLAQQFAASSNLFRRMLRDRRNVSELRDAAAILSDLSRRADRGYLRRSQWSDAQRTLADILRELNVGGGYDDGSGGGRGDGRVSGRVRWRGTVDDEVNLVIRDDSIEVRTIGGSIYNDATYNFTSPLPRRRVTVSVNKLNGRGDVVILQQPSRDNNFTAVIQIRDPKGGARDYEIDVSW